MLGLKLFWREYVQSLVAKEVSCLSKYYDETVQLRPLDHDDGQLLKRISASKKASSNRYSAGISLSRKLLLLNGNINHSTDLAKLFLSLAKDMNRYDRLALVVYNSHYRWLYQLVHKLGLRPYELPVSFVTQNDLFSMIKLAGLECTRYRPVAYIPFRLLGLGDYLNSFLQAVPFIRWFGFAQVCVLRLVDEAEDDLSLSVIAPARNEKGNIKPLLQRIGALPSKTELIFVEGNSTDETWSEIQRCIDEYEGPITVKAIKQTGKGKANAVREGIAISENELIAILDTDCSTPPEVLASFYEAFKKGRGDFINGNRLMYPMAEGAMERLNFLGNHFFAWALSFVLELHFGDTLCGTKLFLRSDYARFQKWRKDFGDFDPFGDFELLFPAASLGIGSIDLPIHYQARTYGQTNIFRFRNGAQLFLMAWKGLVKIRMTEISKF